MEIQSGERLVCRHCGGALMKRDEDATCIMCGRISTHICDNCQFTEEKSAPVSKKKKPKAA